MQQAPRQNRKNSSSTHSPFKGTYLSRGWAGAELIEKNHKFSKSIGTKEPQFNMGFRIKGVHLITKNLLL